MSEMPPAELERWWAVFEVEGMRHEWWQAGTICATIENCFRMLAAGLAGRDVDPETFSQPTDFIPHRGQTHRPQTAAEMKQRGMSYGQ